MTTFIAVLLSLINIGSSVAFNDVVSLVVVGLWSSYLIGNLLFLWRRVTGGVQEPSDLSERDLSKRLEWGPWRIPEPLGTINNIFGCAFMVVILFFSWWPPSNSPTPQTMNFSIVMEAGVLLFAVIYYFIWGSRDYHGPVVEV